jgi:isoleucyl-tRNA synthetase
VFETSRAITEFSDNLSNWYIRRCRERYWLSEMNDDKLSAFMTLYTVLETLARLIAPFTPFVSEIIYQNIVGSFKDGVVSVHLSDFPKYEKKYIDKELEDGMQLVLDIVFAARTARNNANIKNRQPLSKLIVMHDRDYALSGELLEIIKGELNVKEIELANDVSSYIGYELKPNLKTLGPKYSVLLPSIKEYLSACDSNAVVAQINKNNKFSFKLSESEIVLTRDDILISPSQREGYAAESYKNVTAVLDVSLKPELVAEGCARELVSKVQALRKESGFNITDRIIIYYCAEPALEKVIAGFKETIASDTLADKLVKADKAGKEFKALDINGQKIYLKLEVKK